jgi:predicted transcriptional regulator of viral defense system
MKYKNEILKLFNNGYLTTKDVIEHNIPRIYLSRLIDEHIIERVSRGVYIKTNDIPDDMIILQNKSKNAIYSHMTALYLYGLSNRIPIKYDITVNQGYNGTLQKENNVNLFYVKRDLLNLGLTTYMLDSGYEIKVYDLERTICDIIKNKNRLDQEVVNKSIREYFYSNNKNILKLYEYAKKLRIYDKVRNTFEVLK